MKKFLAILLTLSIMCSLIVVPAMTVSAAETSADIVLYKDAYDSTITDYNDIKNADESELTSRNITTGGATISFTKETGNNATFTRDENGALTVAQSSASTSYPRGRLYIRPDNVDTTATKTFMEFKFKGTFVTSTGEAAKSSNSGAPAYFGFNAIGKTEDGTEKQQRAVQYQFSASTAGATGFARGSGAGGSYTEAKAVTVGDDGYYHFRMASWEDSAGKQYSYIYDMNNNNAVVCYHTFSGTQTNAADTVGHGFYIRYYTGGNDKGTTLTAEIKDLNVYYSYDKIGTNPVASGGTVTYDEETGTYTMGYTTALTYDATKASFKTGSTLTTGYAVMDFDLKKQTPTVNEDGLSADGVTKIMRTMQTGLELFTFGSNAGKVGHRTMSNYLYNVSTGWRTSTASYTGLSFVDDWAKIRIVAVNGTEGGTWAYLIYDMNANAEKPIYIRPTSDTSFSGISFSWVAGQANRGACSTDSTKPKIESPFVLKNVNMYATTNIPAYSHISRIGHGISGNTTPPIVTVDSTTMRWDNAIYVQSPDNSSTAIYAIYDSEGKEIAREIKELKNGLYEFNDTNTFSITGLPDTANLTAKYYLQNGDEWKTTYGEYTDSRVSFESKAEYGWREGVEDDELKTLRFFFTPDFSSLLTPAGFGAYVIPVSIFNEDEVNTTDGVLVDSTVIDPTMTISAGEQYGVDLEDVDEAGENVSVIAKPFIILDGEYVYGEGYTVAPADVLVPDAE